MKSRWTHGVPNPRNAARGGKLFSLVASLTLIVGLVVMMSGAASAGVEPQKSVSHATKPVVGGNLEIVQAGLTWANLDPGTSPSVLSDVNLMEAIYDSLFNTDAKGDVLPGLATSYSISPNHLTYTINLRHGVKFSDGTQFNAAAVKWNLDRDHNALCQCYTGIAAQKSVTTSGNYTVIVHLLSPSAVYIDALALGGGAAFMVSPTAFMKEGAAAFQTQPVGAGPYTVTQNLVSSQIELTKNPLYWNKPEPYLKEITVVSTGNDTASLDSVLSHTAGLAVTSDFPTIISAKKVKHLEIVQELPTTFNYITINDVSGPFAGSAGLVAREAIAQAIDQKSIINNLTFGLAPATESLFAKGELFYPGRIVPGYLAYNPKAAAAKVATLPASQKSFTYFDLNSVTPAIATRNEALATMWEAVGFKVHLEDYSHTQAIGLFNSGNFAVTLGTYGGTLDPGLSTALRVYYPTSLNSGYDDPLVNTLVNRAAATFNKAQRGALYKQLAVQVNKDAADIPLFQTITDQIGTQLLRGLTNLPVIQFSGLWLAK